MSVIRNIINVETLKGANIIGAFLLNSAETNMEVNDGRQINILERKTLSINSLLGRINLKSRGILNQDNLFMCHLNFSINKISFFSIFGRHKATTGIIKCHGHADECYEYCLELTSLLTYISATYEND
uniref:Recep_L_domain domain-containing protein n=1 Tax=Strongyloides venezuelensis TaxID=75913 RepID=A0A0K0FZ92_STRVS